VILVGANAALMFIALLRLLLVVTETNPDFLAAADLQFVSFVGLVSIFFPLAAVLLATHIKPPVPRAKLITLLAVIEYGFGGLMGLICLFLGFVNTIGKTGSGLVVDAFTVLLGRLVMMIVFAFAAFVVFRVFQGAYVVPKPKPATPLAGYGQPGYPGGYPGYQQGYQQAPGYGQYQPPGYQAPGYQYPSPGYQGGYAPPPSSAPPASAPPASAPPASGPPASGPYAPYYPPPTSVPPSPAAPSEALDDQRTTALPSAFSVPPSHTSPDDEGFDRTQVVPPPPPPTHDKN
jgi:hypothetical protein